MGFALRPASRGWRFARWWAEVARSCPRPGAISTVLVRPLAAALAPAPAALAELFRATDLTPQMLADPEARVTASQFCIAWAEALRLYGAHRPGAG